MAEKKAVASKTTQKVAGKTANKTASGFNMAEEIRKVLKGNPKLKLAETLATLVKTFPKKKFNKGSFNVAFYTARNQMGIKAKKTTRQRKKTTTSKKTTVVKRTPAATNQSVNLATLQAAAKFIAEAGGTQQALDAIRLLRDLQIS